ncbi:MAG: hypothetical protein QG597_1150 [Actinomycetota bacterium]|nr:hypothetical protein [Actinomycetota bacterium]
MEPPSCFDYTYRSVAFPDDVTRSSGSCPSLSTDRPVLLGCGCEPLHQVLAAAAQLSGRPTNAEVRARRAQRRVALPRGQAGAGALPLASIQSTGAALALTSPPPPTPQTDRPPSHTLTMCRTYALRVRRSRVPGGLTPVLPYLLPFHTGSGRLFPVHGGRGIVQYQRFREGSVRGGSAENRKVGGSPPPLAPRNPCGATTFAPSVHANWSEILATTLPQERNLWITIALSPSMPMSRDCP